MASFDTCINATFEPGNIGSSIGTTPVVISPGSLYNPESYDPDVLVYSYDFTKFYNFAHLLHQGLY